MNRLVLIWLTLASLFLAGCAHTSSDSTVNADGSWSRTLKLSVGKTMTDDKWADVFSLPGAEWNKSEEIKENEKITTLKRTFQAGDGPVTDIIVREKETTKLKNFVVVRKLEGGKIEYYEKIVFLSPKNKEKQDKEAESYINELKAAMPAGKATDADYQAMAKKTFTALTRLLFGPDDHLLGTMILNPDGAARRLRAKIGGIENKALIEQFGDRLTAEERETIIKKILSKFDKETLVTNNKPSSNPDESDQSPANFIGMSVSVKLPGKIIESNGEIDAYTGEVFWDFTSNSAEPDVLELRAVCQL